MGGWKSHELSPFQSSDRITISVWDIPLWDMARQIAIDENIKLSTLVYQALRTYLAGRSTPSWGRVRDPSEYVEAATSWRVKRMNEVDAIIKGEPRSKLRRRLSRTEEHYIETQQMLNRLEETTGTGQRIEGVDDSDEEEDDDRDSTE